METTFKPVEVIAVANAIFRNQGYIKKNETNDLAVNGPVTQANSYLLREHCTGSKPVLVTDVDRNQAEEIIVYLTGLSFKAMERGLTDFETNVLKFVTSESVTIKDVGMAASMPQVYDFKLKQDAWEERERELAELSEFEGKIKQRSDFMLTVENVRYIGRTGSYLYCTSTEKGNIVKFFFQEKFTEVGETVALSGYVKSQDISKYHGGKETMINRVKVA